MSIEWKTLAPVKPTQPVSTSQVLRQALGTSRELLDFLSSSAASGEPILLLVNDPHRSTQTRPVLEELAGLIDGIPSESVAAGTTQRSHSSADVTRFRAVVATGTHQFSRTERNEFERTTFADCGLDISDISWHDARQADSLVELSGVRWHRWLVQSRFILPIGSVEPHYFAGVTGPHKTATIGCISFDDIQRNHAEALSPDSDILRLRGNPVYDGAIELLHKLESAGKKICAIGQVVCGDAMVAVEVGDCVSVIESLLPAARRTYAHTIARAADVLHLRVPQPLGRNLYQADKALKNNHRAVRDGGGIVLEADCTEGIGPDAFMSLLCEASDYNTALQIVQSRGYRLGDHKAVKLHHLMDPACRNVRVALVSNHLTASDMKGTAISVFPDVAPALDWLADVTTAPPANGLIIEDAAMLCVTAEGG